MFNLSKTPKVISTSSEAKQRVKVIDASHSGGPELMIMDDIGESPYGGGIAAETVKGFLSANQGVEVVARFNSLGGDAFEGLVMHNAIAEHGNVTAIIDGIAFSAASIAAAGANRLVMQEASTFGIHRSWTGAAGNIHALAATIEWLDSVDEHQISIFTARTGRSRDEVVAWLEGTDDGTVFSAAEALAAGFADEVIPIKQRQATEQQAAATYACHRNSAKMRQRIIKRGR